MFDFQKLVVYQKAMDFNKSIYSLLSERALDRVIQDQLRRASFSIMLNIAEGSGRFSKRDGPLPRESSLGASDIPERDPI